KYKQRALGKAWQYQFERIACRLVNVHVEDGHRNDGVRVCLKPDRQRLGHIAFDEFELLKVINWGEALMYREKLCQLRFIACRGRIIAFVRMRSIPLVDTHKSPKRIKASDLARIIEGLVYTPKIDQLRNRRAPMHAKLTDHTGHVDDPPIQHVLIEQ